MKEKEKEDVNTQVEPSKPEENAPSPEVKREPAGNDPEKVKEVDTSKYEEQIGNLNTALKAEREEKRKKEEAHQQEMEELKAKLEPIERLQDAFRKSYSPQQEEEEDPQPAGLTEAELESFWQKKEEERKQQEERERRQTLIKNEVDSLSKEYDGSNGKPKFDDDEVIAWQQENNKLYLTPREAFREMKHNEIIDYEINKRMEKTPQPESQEIPGGAPKDRQPKEFKIETESDTRAAVIAAMEAEEANLDT